MKILLSANNSISSGILMKRTLDLFKDHEVKICAYNKSSMIIEHVDWLMDSLITNIDRNAKKLLNIKDRYLLGSYNSKNLEILIKDIKEYSPDLIITDMDMLIANVAVFLGIKLWYHSPQLLLKNTNWTHILTKQANQLVRKRNLMSRYPLPSNYLCVTPLKQFCNEDYNIVTPFINKEIKDSKYKFKHLFIINDENRFENIFNIVKYKEDMAIATFLNKTDLPNVFDLKNNEIYRELLGSVETIILDGDSCYLTDAIFNKKKIVMSPTLNELESIMNANLIEINGIGKNIGQFELMSKKYSMDYLNSALKNVGSIISTEEFTIKDYINASSYSF